MVCESAQYLDPWPVGGRSSTAAAATPRHLHRAVAGGPGQFVGQAGFADAWLPGYQGGLAATGERVVQEVTEACELALVAHQRSAACSGTSRSLRRLHLGR